MQQCVGLDDVVDAARRAAHCVHQVRWTRASYGTSADSRWDGWTYMDVPYAKLSIRDRSKGDRKSNRMSTSMAHVWGVSGMHTGDCWVDFSKPVARDFSV